MSQQSPGALNAASDGNAKSPQLWRAWILVFVCLYALLLAVGLVGNGFKIAAGGDEAAENMFSFAVNPLTGLFLGILATVLLQSSSTVTAVIVGLVASGVLPVPIAVPMIMGSNLGTTVTNTLICMAYLTRKSELRRAFAAATVHDFFNILAIVIILPLELLTGFLEKTAQASAGLLRGSDGATFPNPIRILTRPVENLLHGSNGTGLLGSLPDIVAGVILAFIGLALIIGSITVMGKLLRRVMQGRAERVFHAAVGRGPLAGVVSGTVVTVLVQSSTTTTSLIVPMAGAGIIRLDKVFPFTVGANIGTCVTALLASMAGGKSPELALAALQIALVHLYFNLLATLIIMGIPWLRRLPPYFALRLALLAVRKRALAIGYVAVTYVIIPALFLVVSVLVSGVKTLPDLSPDAPEEHHNDPPVPEHEPPPSLDQEHESTSLSRRSFHV
ncbi:MAG: Na/Pi cotransporter family protein [Planctomycetota bacterium]|nr:MAG: Na/Pi cotransporter family protein [Planctomycetota bacterium]